MVYRKDMVDSDATYARQAEDFVLLRRYATSADAETFRLLCRRHLAFVHAVCRRELPTPEAAEDATQAVFIALAKKGRRLRPDTILPAWLFRVALLTCRSVRRAEARRSRVEKSVQAPDPTRHDPHLYWAIAELPTPDRNVIVLKFLEEKTYREVATTLGTTEDAARMRIQRALEKLRRRLGYAPIFLPLDLTNVDLPLPGIPGTAGFSRRFRSNHVTYAIPAAALLLVASLWIATKSPAGSRTQDPTPKSQDPTANSQAQNSKIQNQKSKIDLLPFHAHVQIFEEGKLGFEGDTWRTADTIRWRSRMGSQLTEVEVKNNVLHSIADPNKPAPDNVAAVIVGPPEQRAVETDAFEAALIELPVYIHRDPPLPIAPLPDGSENPAKVDASGDRHYTVWRDRAHGNRVSKVDYKVGDFRFLTTVTAWQKVANIDLPSELTADSWFQNAKSAHRTIKLTDVQIGREVQPPPMPTPLDGALVMDNIRHTAYRIDTAWRRITKEIPVTDGNIKH